MTGAAGSSTNKPLLILTLDKPLRFYWSAARGVDRVQHPGLCKSLGNSAQSIAVAPPTCSRMERHLDPGKAWKSFPCSASRARNKLLYARLYSMSLVLSVPLITSTSSSLDHISKSSMFYLSIRKDKIGRSRRLHSIKHTAEILYPLAERQVHVQSHWQHDLDPQKLFLAILDPINDLYPTQCFLWRSLQSCGDHRFSPFLVCGYR